MKKTTFWVIKSDLDLFLAVPCLGATAIDCATAVWFMAVSVLDWWWLLKQFVIWDMFGSMRMSLLRFVLTWCWMREFVDLNGFCDGFVESVDAAGNCRFWLSYACVGFWLFVSCRLWRNWFFLLQVLWWKLAPLLCCVSVLLKQQFLSQRW